MNIRINERKLTDGSLVSDVIITDHAATITLAAISHAHAVQCANLLKQVIEHNTVEVVEID